MITLTLGYNTAYGQALVFRKAKKKSPGLYTATPYKPCVFFMEDGVVKVVNVNRIVVRKV